METGWRNGMYGNVVSLVLFVFLFGFLWVKKLSAVCGEIDVEL